jgi:hypothetical protein
MSVTSRPTPSSRWQHPTPSSPRRSRTVLALLAGGMTAVILLVPRDVPASIQEQRARLPPPADCPDPVEGYWKAHYYQQQYGHWYVRTLEIHRKDKELTGKIIAHYWDGSPTDVNPPPCKPGLTMEQVINMPARGTFEDGNIDFGGTSWTAEPPICSKGTVGYNPDRFTGKLDPKLHEFISVNNDGGIAVNEPNVFRRIRCLEAPPPSGTAGEKVQPPPFEPPKRLMSCGKGP